MWFHIIYFIAALLPPVISAPEVFAATVGVEALISVSNKFSTSSKFSLVIQTYFFLQLTSSDTFGKNLIANNLHSDSQGVKFKYVTEFTETDLNHALELKRSLF